MVRILQNTGGGGRAEQEYTGQLSTGIKRGQAATLAGCQANSCPTHSTALQRLVIMAGFEPAPFRTGNVSIYSLLQCLRPLGHMICGKA